MKKAKDEIRPEYSRSDFVKLDRGRFHEEVAAGTSVVLLDPANARAFPTSQAVNEALSGLLALTETTVRITRRGRGRARENG